MGVVEAARKIRASAGAKTDITVRALVEWTYADQQAHRGSNAGASGYAGISQTGIVSDICALGCMIDKSPSGAQFYGVTHIDDDALTVHDHVECLFHEYRTALITHGAVRSAPDWCPVRVPLQTVAVPGRKGQPRGIYDRHGNAIGHEVTYEGDVGTREEYARMRSAWCGAPILRIYEDVVEYAREQYIIWYESLCAVQDALSFGRLRRWHVAGIGARAEPWLN